MALSSDLSSCFDPGELDRLFTHIYSLHHKEIDPGLERVSRFLHAWGDPQNRLPPVIHIAGTNGKGSTLAYLLSMIQQAGLSAHRYTSPHLIKFNERIQINGQNIDDETLLSLIKEGLEINKNQPVSFFEFTTALAFQAFARHPADVVLLETGMGGRLDATNVIHQPMLTIITPIERDHTEFLGETLPQIAKEKAGIIKPGSPCLVAPQKNDAVYEVFQKVAEQKNAPLYLYGRDWHYDVHSDYFTVSIHDHKYAAPFPSMRGDHQIMNAAVALAASYLMSRDIPLDDEHRANGIQKAFWPARLQDISKLFAAPQNGSVILDGGHNPGCAEAIAHYLERMDQQCHLVLGMQDNKDPVSFVERLQPNIKEIACVPIQSYKATKAETLQKKLSQKGIKSRCFSSPRQAVETITQENTPPFIILISGSLYLAGDVLAENYPL